MHSIPISMNSLRIVSVLGYWMMHCHFSDHVTQGMAVIMQVGEDGTEIPQPSSDFPQCGNYPNPKKQSVFMLPLEDLRDRI